MRKKVTPGIRRICLLLALDESHQVQPLVSVLWRPWSGLFISCSHQSVQVIRCPPGPSLTVPLDLKRPILSDFCSFPWRMGIFIYFSCHCGTCAVLDCMPRTPCPVVLNRQWAEHTEEVAVWQTFIWKAGHSFLSSQYIFSSWNFCSIVVVSVVSSFLLIFRSRIFWTGLVVMGAVMVGREEEADQEGRCYQHKRNSACLQATQNLKYLYFRWRVLV